MRENVASILKQCGPGTLGGTIDLHIQQWKKYRTSTCTSIRDNFKVYVWLATGIRNGKHSMLYLAYRKRCMFEHVCESPSFSITA